MRSSCRQAPHHRAWQVVKFLCSDPRTSVRDGMVDGGTPFFIAAEKGHIGVRLWV